MVTFQIKKPNPMAPYGIAWLTLMYTKSHYSIWIALGFAAYNQALILSLFCRLLWVLRVHRIHSFRCCGRAKELREKPLTQALAREKVSLWEKKIWERKGVCRKDSISHSQTKRSLRDHRVNLSLDPEWRMYDKTRNDHGKVWNQIFENSSKWRNFENDVWSYNPSPNFIPNI